MKKIGIFLILILILCLIMLSGCFSSIEEGDVSLQVTKVEKRLYDEDGDPASDGHIFVFVYFSIQNNANEELSLGTYWFKLWTPHGTYSSEWFSGGGTEVSSVSEGAKASGYIVFEILEDLEITNEYKLKYSGWQTTKTASFKNIQSGFSDVFLVTLSIDDYYYSDSGDYSWESADEGFTYVYVNITLENSNENDDVISTSSWNFDLYTSEGTYTYNGDESGIPSEIGPGDQASWYIYFEIPEDSILEKLQYDTLGVAPTVASFY